MSNRDELADELRGAVGDNYDPAFLQWHEDGIRDSIDWAGAAGDLAGQGWSKPRTADSAEELDALPDLSAVIDKHHDVSQKRGGRWCGYETADLTSKQIAKYKPIRVLSIPEATA